MKGRLARAPESGGLRRQRRAGAPLEVQGAPPKFLGGNRIGGIVGRAAAKLGLALEMLLCSHGRSSRARGAARSSTRCARVLFPISHNPNSDLRGIVGRRNGLDMHETSPLCPNCVHPMRLTRRIAPDETHRGQDVFECATCRVAMTQGEASGPQAAGR